MKQKKKEQKPQLEKSTVIPRYTLCKWNARCMSQVSQTHNIVPILDSLALYWPVRSIAHFPAASRTSCSERILFHLSKDPLIRSRKSPAGGLMRNLPPQSYSTRRTGSPPHQPVSRSLPQRYRDARKTSVPRHWGRHLVPGVIWTLGLPQRTAKRGKSGSLNGAEDRVSTVAGGGLLNPARMGWRDLRDACADLIAASETFAPECSQR